MIPEETKNTAMEITALIMTQIYPKNGRKKRKLLHWRNQGECEDALFAVLTLCTCHSRILRFFF